MNILSVLCICTMVACFPDSVDRNLDDVRQGFDDNEDTQISDAVSRYDDGGLLFAHMKDNDYGRLYYYISKDGAVWTPLNNDTKVNARYVGHPDIIKGGDGLWYMITGRTSAGPEAQLYYSEDLINWKTRTTIPSSKLFANTPGYWIETTYFGAPKMFYDEDSGQYIITWHSHADAYKGGYDANAPRTLVDNMWASSRTFYVLTTDFKNFTKPERLFDFKSEEFKDVATIDVIIRKIDGKYWAIFKDERYPVNASTGKTVLIVTSDNLTGPWTEPVSPVTPMTEVVNGAEGTNNYHEAPAIAPAPDGKGWFIFAEKYPIEYHRFDIGKMAVTGWSQFPMAIPNARHGCMVRINQEEYDLLMEVWGPQEDEE